MLKQPSLEGVSLETLFSVFTLEERRIIEDMCKKEQAQSIPGVISIFDPEREYKLEAIIAILTTPKVTQESKVRQELEAKIAQGFVIDTPEKEKEWEEKLQIERMENENKVLKERTRIVRNLKSVQKKEDVEEETKEEVSEEAPKRRGRAKKEEVKEEPTSDASVVDG